MSPQTPPTSPLLTVRTRTGATGYIGGDVLSVLATKYFSLSISVLVRSPEKAQQVQAQFPSVRIVHGGLDDSDLLEKESADADIVLRAY